MGNRSPYGGNSLPNSGQPIGPILKGQNFFYF